jgi:hypothetical protein
MKRIFVIGTLAILLVTLVGCTPGPNDLAKSPDEGGEVAGFWLGLWHGLIAPITFIVSLFSDSVSVYEVHNNGGWYNFGFLIGVSIIFGGSGGGATRARCSKAKD